MSVSHENELVEKEVNEFRSTFTALKDEISKFIVGQDEVVNHVLISIIAGGHVLLEGVPGLGKTALVNTISKAIHLDSKRIQFTPDLLPADILGTNILVERDGEKIFEFQKGPVFTNILLADEINRATPKTQSALLETMQEKTVTVANKTHILDKPYFVLATQNPLEMDGTYPLPEAQLDRFFFKLDVKMPNHDEFSQILDRTTGLTRPEIKAITNGERIIEMGKTACQVPIAEDIKNYLIKLAISTHPEKDESPNVVKQYIRYGVSPRAAQAILLAARIHALIAGRYHVAKEDINAVAIPAMRHRMLLSFEGEAEGITTEQIIKDIIQLLN
ncbi:MoxR family ATPase [Lentisphaera marina]|uniref:AAA family ATPase n=1 Tax=Lentisphaera marina TaxID=1111041 RepID=UPI00236553F0|nr:MoxR family ATPase [Lentisphaera marina]MDD7986843.1 MoxR family ATPase [Lentisphaera marina]